MIMRSYKLNLIILAILAIAVTAFSDEIDYKACIKKYNSAWGEECKQCTSYNNSYKVFLRNTCDEKVDVKVAVQEVDKRWKTFTHNEMAPNDTMIAYACNGKGKYLYWARKAGDKSVDFPTDAQINTEFGK